MRAASLLVLMIGLTAHPTLHAQDRRATDYAWTPIAQQDGLQLDYIYYGAREDVRGGLVIRLRNENDYDVGYRFVVIIRSRERHFEREVTGTVEALMDKTGDSEGLYWQPFPVDEPIGEVGLRGLRVWRADPPS